MTRMKMLCLALVVASTGAVAADDNTGIKAGAAERDITPPVGLEIQHYYRKSIGIHEPLFARCLYLEDLQGNSVAGGVGTWNLPTTATVMVGTGEVEERRIAMKFTYDTDKVGRHWIDIRVYRQPVGT